MTDIVLTGLKRGVTDSVASITQAADTIAELRLLTTSTGPDSPKFIYVDGYLAAGDGGGGFFEYIAGDTFSDDNSATVFVDASARRWYRSWDGVNFMAAWAGIFTTTPDIAVLIPLVPKFCFCHFPPGTFTVNSNIPQANFSNVFWRGISTIWSVTKVNTAFDVTKVILNWTYVPITAIQNGTYNVGSAGDMTTAGLSAIEGIGIVNQESINASVGVQMGAIIYPSTSSARSTTSKTTGKFHFEVTLDVATPASQYGNIGVGIATAAHVMQNNPGADLESIGYYNNPPSVYINNAILGDGPVAAEGQITAYEVDLDAQTFKIQNVTTAPGVWVTFSFASLPAATPYFVLLSDVVRLASATVNFGATPFAAAVTSGYSAWGAGTTLNPADQYTYAPDQIAATFSNGNLTMTNNNYGLPGDYPRNYYLRPKNFSVGGFYVNLGYTVPVHCFLTGPEGVVLKNGSIGLQHDQSVSLDSGENLCATNCNLNGVSVDGAQITNVVKYTLEGCSFTYSTRILFAANSGVFLRGSYIETSAGGFQSGPFTTGELIALDGGANLLVDYDCSILLLPASASDLVAFYAGGGGYAQAYFDGPLVYNRDGNTVVRPAVQYLIHSEGKNVQGYTRGFNGDNVPFGLSPNQNLQPNWNFATAGLALYPGSTGVTNQTSVFHAPQTNAAKFANAGGTLQGATFNVNPGDNVFISFFDKVTSGTTGVFPTGQVTYSTADGVAIGTAAFTAACGIPNFVPGGVLNPSWPPSAARDWTIERFAFKVPSGATKMTWKIDQPNSGDTAYYVSEMVIYKNAP